LRRAAMWVDEKVWLESCFVGEEHQQRRGLRRAGDVG